MIGGNIYADVFVAALIFFLFFSFLFFSFLFLSFSFIVEYHPVIHQNLTTAGSYNCSTFSDHIYQMHKVFVESYKWPVFTNLYVDPETLPNCLIYICALFQKQKLFYIFTQLLKSWSTLSSSCTILRPIYSRQYIMHHHHHMIWNKICMIERKTQHIFKRRYTWAWNSSSVVQDKHCMHACVAIIYW
jgi:hypothetical protein